MENEDQLTLPFGLSEEMLKDHLQKAAGKKVSLRINDNSTSMISARARDGVLHVRLHRMFLHADNGLLDELSHFVRGRKVKTPLIRAFIERHRGMLRKCEPRQPRINQQGRYHDLASLSESVNREYFGGSINASSTWGIRRRGRAVRRRTLGSYSSHTNTIRINPELDKRSVPPYFIEFIIYHEMLHADMGVGTGTKRRAVHPREFRRREKMFKRYAEALAWEKDNL
jgi:predicted metal-dependent hydrolase